MYKTVLTQTENFRIRKATCGGPKAQSGVHTSIRTSCYRYQTKIEKNDQQQQREIDRLKKEFERKDTEIASYQIQTKTKHEEVIQLQKELGQKYTESFTYQSELSIRQKELELTRKEGIDLRLAADKFVMEH